ncbi:DUF4430 domain-containing protein [Patescibacteria group bacterium]|nr:DUF4430 domain-containing protein [Patescibacteria group bacterium]MBU1728012.1 DUF4430 domain-containing protein [Patescibacteria group bacterium]
MTTRKEKIKKLIIIGVLLSVCLVLISIYKTPTKKETSINTIESPAGIATLFVNEIKYEGKIQNETSVYEFMSQLREDGKINFKEKEYPGMGKFIEEINGLKNNGERNWIYYVNDKKAEVGVSNYKINKGDIVSWKYEK